MANKGFKVDKYLHLRPQPAHVNPEAGDLRYDLTDDEFVGFDGTSEKKILLDKPHERLMLADSVSIETPPAAAVALGTRDGKLLIKTPDGVENEVGGGDFLELENRMMEQFQGSTYQYMTPVIFAKDSILLDGGGSTGEYSPVSKTFEMASGESMLSENILDPNFLAEDVPVQNLQITSFWDKDGKDAEATYEVVTRPDFMGRLGTGFSGGTIDAVEAQDDGKILVGGSFTALNGSSRGKLVRLNIDGTEDLTFKANIGTGFNTKITAIVCQPDGKVIVGGSFTTFNSNPRGSIVRLNADGSEDLAFSANVSTGANSAIYGLALQADGKIVVGGWFTTFAGVARKYLIRLNADGTFDSAFYTALGTSFNDSVYKIALQADGKILVGGNFTSVNGVSSTRLARIGTAGTVDSAFSSNLGAGFDSVPIVLVEAGSGIIVGGYFTKKLARLAADGTPDSTFSSNLGTGFDNTAYSGLYFQGSVIVGGNFSTLNGVTRPYLAVIDPATGLQNTALLNQIVTSGVEAGVFAMALKNDALMFGGNFQAFNSSTVDRLMVLSAQELAPDPYHTYPISSNLQAVGNDTFVGTAENLPPLRDELRLKITASANGKKLKGFGLFYSLDSSSVEGVPQNYRKLLDENFLGSIDPSLDRSEAGRGIRLRREDGQLVELTIGAGNTIQIWEIT